MDSCPWMYFCRPDILYVGQAYLTVFGVIFVEQKYEKQTRFKDVLCKLDFIWLLTYLECVKMKVVSPEITKYKGLIHEMNEAFIRDSESHSYRWNKLTL